ncbi:MAG: hypothetical protein AAFZ15_01110 [Bacteroidota bacterium]
MSTQELLWKYAEGQCTPSELLQIEKQLTDDLALQKELDQVLELQSVLVSMEPDAPSMRFAQNVMDTLPAIYPSEVTEPLISSIWKKIFWVALGALAAAIFFLPRSAQPSGDLLTPYLDPIASGISHAFGQVPTVTLQYFVLTLLSIGLLALMDKFFLRKVRGLMLV